MCLFDKDSSDDNLDIIWGNLSKLKNELLWLLEFQVDQPPEQFDPIVLNACRRYLRPILEELPPFLRRLRQERPEASAHCNEMLATCAHLRRLHPTDDASVWSGTYTQVHSLQDLIDEVRYGPAQSGAEPVLSASGTARIQPPAQTLPAQSAEPENAFVLAGDHLRIRYEGEETTLRNLIGLRCIQELLRRPGQEIYAGLLHASVTGSQTDTSATDATLIDREALQAYREDLDRKQAEFTCLPDSISPGYREDLEHDISVLKSEIGRAVGLGGTLRQADDEREKARKRVGGAIIRAYAKIGKSLPRLENHLRGAIHQGEYLSYRPDRKIEWGF